MQISIPRLVQAGVWEEMKNSNILVQLLIKVCKKKKKHIFETKEITR